MAMTQVQILLSTWNGERWLPALLDSLLQQTYTDWELLIRDDGSQDQTLKILLEWKQANPEKVAILEINGMHLGSAFSFSRLVEMSTAPLLMFCDQDDVWLPQKISVKMDAMQRLSAQNDINCSLLVHTDLTLINAQDELLADSFWQWRGFDTQQSKQGYLLTNTVTGCATLFNQVTAEKAFPLPAGVQHHDHWLALVCAWFGEIYPIEQPTVHYRQHDDNEVGAGLANYLHVTAASIPGRVEAWSKQAEIFLHCFGSELSAADCRLIEALAGLRYLNGWERRGQIVQHRLFKQGVLANLALLCFA